MQVVIVVMVLVAVVVIVVDSVFNVTRTMITKCSDGTCNDDSLLQANYICRSAGGGHRGPQRLLAGSDG